MFPISWVYSISRVTVTYLSLAVRGQRRSDGEDEVLQLRSRTSCRQGRRDSEGVFLQLSDEITYILCVCRPRDGEGMFLQLINESTYNLWCAKKERQ